MALAAGFHRAQETVFAEHDAVRHHFSLSNRRAQPPGGRDQHMAFGGLAQATAGRARGNQRLDQHAHRGVGRRQFMIFHVAAGVRGPQRRPAGAHRGQEFGLNAEPQKTFELAGEIRTLAVLEQRRGTHHTEGTGCTLRAPGRQQGFENFRRNRLLVERQPDRDREPARGRLIGLVVLRHHVRDAEMAQLIMIGRRRERKSARRRQAGLRQRGEISRLRPDVFRIGGGRIGEREDEGHVAHEFTGVLFCSLSPLGRGSG